MQVHILDAVAGAHAGAGTAVYGFPRQDQKNICLSLFDMFLYVAKHDLDVFGCVVGQFIVLILKDKAIIMLMARQWPRKDIKLYNGMAPSRSAWCNQQTVPFERAR